MIFEHTLGKLKIKIVLFSSSSSKKINYRSLVILKMVGFLLNPHLNPHPMIVYVQGEHIKLVVITRVYHFKHSLQIATTNQIVTQSVLLKASLLSPN